MFVNGTLLTLGADADYVWLSGLVRFNFRVKHDDRVSVVMPFRRIDGWKTVSVPISKVRMESK